MWGRRQVDQERAEERAQWRGRVDQMLKDCGKQISSIEESVKHLHDCMEKKVTPLIAWQNKLLGIVMFITIVLPVLLWLLSGYRPGGGK